MNIQEYEANVFYPRKKAIHDCVDTGNTISLVANQLTLFLCDCQLRDYKTLNGPTLWYPADSLLKDTIDDTYFVVEINATLNGLKDTRVDFVFVIPHPDGDIHIKTKNMVTHKNNTDDQLTLFTALYNGIDSNAKTYGFKVYVRPTANIQMKARSILVCV